MKQFIRKLWNWNPYLLVLILFVPLLQTSVVIHELSHVGIALLFGAKISEIYVSFLGGYIKLDTTFVGLHRFIFGMAGGFGQFVFFAYVAKRTTKTLAFPAVLCMLYGILEGIYLSITRFANQPPVEYMADWTLQVVMQDIMSLVWFNTFILSIELFAILAVLYHFTKNDEWFWK